jgi:hypothetical protein
MVTLTVNFDHFWDSFSELETLKSYDEYGQEIKQQQIFFENLILEMKNQHHSCSKSICKWTLNIVTISLMLPWKHITYAICQVMKK